MGFWDWNLRQGTSNPNSQIAVFVLGLGAVRWEPVQPRRAILLQHPRRGETGEVCLEHFWIVAGLQPGLSGYGGHIDFHG